MLHLIPAGLHRLLLRAAHGFRRHWWRLARPELTGVCVIAQDDAGRVLLLRQSYGTTRWVLPGGGVGWGENVATAAEREFREEVGCDLAVLSFAGISAEELHGTANAVHVFTARLAGTPQVDGREIVEARLFALDALPPEISTRVLRRMVMAGVYSSDN